MGRGEEMMLRRVETGSMGKNSIGFIRNTKGESGKEPRKGPKQSRKKAELRLRVPCTSSSTMRRRKGGGAVWFQELWTFDCDGGDGEKFG
eukprot:gene39961-48676_t